MSYGAAGPCPYFVIRPKKCKITAKIGKKLKKILGCKTLPWTNFWKFGQIFFLIISMSSNIFELVIYKRKKNFKKKLLPGVLPLAVGGRGENCHSNAWGTEGRRQKLSTALGNPSIHRGLGCKLQQHSAAFPCKNTLKFDVVFQHCWSS
jgi:hypothetical protein